MPPPTVPANFFPTHIVLLDTIPDSDVVSEPEEKQRTFKSWISSMSMSDELQVCVIMGLAVG